MDLKLGIDIQNKALLSPDGTPLTLPPLVQGDDISITLQGMERLTNGDYLRVPIDFSRIKIGIGLVDAPPISGTFCLEIAGVRTPALAYNASKEFISSKLNELSTVISRGGIRLLDKGAANIHLIAWNDATVTTPVTVVEKKLFPHCFSRVITWPQEVGTIFIVKLFQAPLAFTDAFALPSSPPVTVVAVRSGTGTRNEIQRLNVPRDAQGEFSLTWNGLTTVIIPVAEASAITLAAALNNLYSDSVIRFKVTQPGTAYYYVEFTGPLAAAPQSILSATMESQQQLMTPVGLLDLKGAGMEYALSGLPSVTMRLEIEVTTAGGAIGTPIQREVTILNDMLDSTMALVPDPVWLEEQRTKPVVVEYNWEAPPTFLGTIGYAQNAGDAVFIDWQFVHNMGTRDVHITVRDNVTGLRVPDNEYEALILDPNTVQITFAEPPETDRYAVLITAANVGEHFRSHHHAISDIDGLQAILNALTATGNPLDLWPSIPLEKLPKIPFEKMEGSLPDSMLPADVVRLDEDGFLKLSQLPPEIPRLSEDGSLIFRSRTTDSWKELLSSSGELNPNLLGDLSNFPGFTDSVRKVVGGGGTGSSDLFLGFTIPSSRELYPGRIPAPASDEALDALTLPKPGGLLPAVTTSASITSLPVPIPAAADHAGKVFVHAGSTSLILPGGAGRKSSTLLPGEHVASDGRFWFKVSRQGSTTSWHPVDFDRELLFLDINEAMFPVGAMATLKIDFELQVLRSQTRCQWVILLETGTFSSIASPAGTNISGITWSDPILTCPLHLTSIRTPHSFGLRFTRGVSAITAETKLYRSPWQASASAPASAGFLLRARLVRFDTEDALSDPRGYVYLNFNPTKQSLATIVL